MTPGSYSQWLLSERESAAKQARITLDADDRPAKEAGIEEEASAEDILSTALEWGKTVGKWEGREIE